MGTALFSPSLLSANLAALDLVKARGGTVSFDPNLRPELLASPGLVAAKAHSGAVRCGPAQRGRTGPADRRAGRGGCRGRAFILRPQGDRAQARFQPGFPVPEVDPTGAGDCFGAAFISLWLRGTDPALALRLAAAAGALAVTRRGPMEGAGTLADLTARAAGAENFSPKNFVSPPDR